MAQAGLTSGSTPIIMQPSWHNITAVRSRPVHSPERSAQGGRRALVPLIAAQNPPAAKWRVVVVRVMEARAALPGILRTPSLSRPRLTKPGHLTCSGVPGCVQGGCRRANVAVFGSLWPGIGSLVVVHWGQNHKWAVVVEILGSSETPRVCQRERRHDEPDVVSDKWRREERCLRNRLSERSRPPAWLLRI
jgi:hypothetical protein